MRKSAFFIFLLAASGCSTIHTQRGVNLQDKSSYITITTDSEKEHDILSGLDKRVVISSLDDESLYRMGWDFNYPDVVHVTPGIHEIGVQYNYKGTYSNGCLWVNAILSESYIVRMKAHEYSVSFWIENTKTHERVGGICGSEPES